MDDADFPTYWKYPAEFERKYSFSKGLKIVCEVFRTLAISHTEERLVADSPQRDDPSLLNVAGDTQSFCGRIVQQKIVFCRDRHKLSVARGIRIPRQISDRFACIRTSELLLGFIKDVGTPN